MIPLEPPVSSKPDAIGWLSAGLLSLPALIAGVWGIFRLIAGVTMEHGSRSVDLGGWVMDDAWSIASVDVLFLVVWVFANSLLVPGLVTGWVRIWRLGKNRWLRSVLLLLGVVSSFGISGWAWLQGSPLAPSGLAMLVGAAVMLVSVGCLLRPRQVAPGQAAFPAT